MELQKINVKFFATDPNNPPLTDFIDLFHGWIQATDGVYHDVADYSHMQAGPGIVLVANDANVSIDETDNRRGLLYSQKSQLSGSNPEKIRTVLRSALENCRRLEAEPSLGNKLKFSDNEAFEEIKPEIESVAQTLFGDADITFERNPDPRQRLNVRIKTSRSLGLGELVRNLQND